MAIPDFYIPSMNLMIEYNGDQHYKPINFGGISAERAKEKFEYQVIRDRQMKEYCVKNDIKFWEIDGRKYKDNKLIKYLNTRFKIIDNKMTYIHDDN